jgi:RNA polymerase sigma-70 factor (ECF subfamily)
MGNAVELVARPRLEAERSPLALADVHAEHTEFIWKTLHRLGVREPIVEDVFQEVFVVVLRRLHTFDGRSALTTWLFGICLRVARSYRRRAYFRRERAVAEVGDAKGPVAPDRTPEEALQRREAEARLQGILDSLELEHRAVFVMFEFDGLGCQEIADMIGVPLGTVHSRLHRARASFARAAERYRAIDARRGP